MAVSEKIENDPKFMPTSEQANRALQSFAAALGLDVLDLQRASSEQALGSIVDRLTTIGVNAQNAQGGEA